jgi:hypothetical protein
MLPIEVTESPHGGHLKNTRLMQRVLSFAWYMTVALAVVLVNGCVLSESGARKSDSQSSSAGTGRSVRRLLLDVQHLIDSGRVTNADDLQYYLGISVAPATNNEGLQDVSGPKHDVYSYRLKIAPLEFSSENFFYSVRRPMNDLAQANFSVFMSPRYQCISMSEVQAVFGQGATYATTDGGGYGLFFKFSDTPRTRLSFQFSPGKCLAEIAIQQR